MQISVPSRFPVQGLGLRHIATAAALLCACAGASAQLQPFTLAPSALGLNGADITADNILISNYSTVMADATGHFTETGYLTVTGFQQGGMSFTPQGLNTDYGLYVKFEGSGTTTTNDPTTMANFGSFDNLTYTLYAYSGSATFGFDGNTPTETATNEIALATGTLVHGTAVTVPTGDGGFTPSAHVSLTVSPIEAAFFPSPSPFSSGAVAAFSNTSTQVEPFEGGFIIRQGGGSMNFTQPVPEPSTYMLLMAGLAAIGFVARRRQRSDRD